MAISVDRVYQTVLAIANKEQRGYITPQEFNLFANQAQNEIFEQYFHDLKLFLRIPGNKTVTSDPREMIEEKISIFRASNQGYATMTQTVYKLEAVRFREAATGIYYAAEEVSKREYDAYHMSSLMAPEINRPIFYRANNGVIYGSPVEGYDDTRIDFIRRPLAPNWTYIEVNGDALWNPSAADAQNFELHPSEEKNLVVKILQFAGVSMKDQMLVQAASSKEVAYIQQEKS